MSQTNWNSSFNIVPFRSFCEEDVIALVNRVLSSGNSKHATSYKYAFFKSILDNIFNVDINTMLLTYDEIAARFTEIYWNLVLKFHLRQQGKSIQHEYTSVEKELFSFCDKYNFDYSDKQKIFPFESLRFDLQLEIIKIIKKQMMRYVIGAFCGDTDDQFYHFNKVDGSEGIILNHDIYVACVKYKSVFEKQNYYEWIKYLEKTNEEEDSYALANKLDASTERANLSIYREILEELEPPKCFYCGCELNNKKRNEPVDHFIPWSFVKDNKLWNFVLACPQCNSSKSNILPDKKYFEVIKLRNSKIVNIDKPIVHEDFKTYSYFRLEEMWHSAVFNGFKNGWKR